jgi:hypothetical protein
LSDLVDTMLPQGRQLKSNAHPLVEITFMRQNTRRLMHFINVSGHADTAYFNPIPMKDIQVSVRGTFRSGRALRSAQTVAIKNNAGYAEFTLPLLEEYELVDLG